MLVVVVHDSGIVVVVVVGSGAGRACRGGLSDEGASARLVCLQTAAARCSGRRCHSVAGGNSLRCTSTIVAFVRAGASCRL
jgi:hypothetical protein